MGKLTKRQMYKKLRNDYLRCYKGHFMDMYEGHNHAERTATLYAIKNTEDAWRYQ